MDLPCNAQLANQPMQRTGLRPAADPETLASPGMVKWDQARTWFEIDGALRDILVRDTVEADWDRLFEAVTEWGYQATWSVGGESIAAPESASAALSDPEPLLFSIQVGPASVNLHFFSVDEIEMDIDPREIQTPSAFEQIQGFISGVGQRLRKPVLLTHEGMHDPAFMVYDPETAGFRLLDS